MNNNTALVTINGANKTRNMALPYSQEEIEAFKDTVKASNREMTNAQFTVFMAAARHLGLDPLARQITPIFQGGKMTVYTTIDGARLIAERTRKYRGQVGPFWCGKDGIWKDVWLEDGPPVAAKVGVKRAGFDEVVWGVAKYKSYAKGGPDSNWQKMPEVMIAKVAEMIALRKAFPENLSGVYSREEMMQALADGEELEPLNIVDAHVTDTSDVTANDDAPQSSQRASEDDQLELAQWLHEARFGKLSAVARFLAECLGHSRVKVRQLEEGHADITADEVATVIAALAARREATADDTGDEVATDADESYDLAALNGGARPS